MRSYCNLKFGPTEPQGLLAFVLTQHLIGQLKQFMACRRLNVWVWAGTNLTLKLIIDVNLTWLSRLIN